MQGWPAPAGTSAAFTRRLSGARCCGARQRVRAGSTRSRLTRPASCESAAVASNGSDTGRSSGSVRQHHGQWNEPVSLGNWQSPPPCPAHPGRLALARASVGTVIPDEETGIREMVWTHTREAADATQSET